MNSVVVQPTISKFFLATSEALTTLDEKKLYGPALVVAYSAIDSLGLLDAPPNQLNASSDSFKAWVDKYLIKQNGITFNAIDLWAARCAVLHTSTSESDLSRAGRAKQLQYYNGDSSHAAARQIVARIQAVDGGSHIAVNLPDLFAALIAAMMEFAPDLSMKCNQNPDCNVRLGKILQLNAI